MDKSLKLDFIYNLLDYRLVVILGSGFLVANEIFTFKLENHI